MSSVAEMELEPPTTRTALLEELRKWMFASKSTSERMSTLLRHRIIRVVAVVESLTQFCGETQGWYWLEKAERGLNEPGLDSTS
jgi:hypothetical protein